MLTFKNFLIEEMPKALANVIGTGNEQAVKKQLSLDFNTVANKLQNPGAASYEFNGKDGWTAHSVNVKEKTKSNPFPVLSFTAKNEETGEAKKVEMTVMAPEDGDVTGISDFHISVDGEKKVFNVKDTTAAAKRTGGVAAGYSYMLLALKEAIKGGKRAAARAKKKEDMLSNLSDAELLELMKQRGIKS